jgi:hypothetical protein
MEDYHSIGFDIGYGKQVNSNFDLPFDDSDRYSFNNGLEEGRRHRRVADELDREIIWR